MTGDVVERAREIYRLACVMPQNEVVAYLTDCLTAAAADARRAGWGDATEALSRVARSERTTAEGAASFHVAANWLRNNRPAALHAGCASRVAQAAMLAAVQIGDEIVAIMETYDQQEAERGYVDTPGGLEHIGDVWKLLESWRDRLKAALPPAPETQQE